MMNHDILADFQTNPNVEPRKVTDERGDRTQAFRGNHVWSKGVSPISMEFLSAKSVQGYPQMAICGWKASNLEEWFHDFESQPISGSMFGYLQRGKNHSSPAAAMRFYCSSWWSISSCSLLVKTPWLSFLYMLVRNFSRKPLFNQHLAFSKFDI